jgi:hypothetical protein
MEEVHPIMTSIRGTNASIAGLIPPNEFWRWRDLWISPLRNAAFSAVLMEFLTNGSLLSLEDTSNVLGSEPFSHIIFSLNSLMPSIVKEEWSDRYMLSVEDYLLALTNVVNELVSWSWVRLRSTDCSLVSVRRKLCDSGEFQ